MVWPINRSRPSNRPVVGVARLIVPLVVDRPRRVGEFPRASFDSSSLSLLAQPGSVVRSINEAVNYQFGFDITSSWGYQLLLRSGVGLGGLAIVVLWCAPTLTSVMRRKHVGLSVNRN